MLSQSLRNRTAVEDLVVLENVAAAVGLLTPGWSAIRKLCHGLVPTSPSASRLVERDPRVIEVSITVLPQLEMERAFVR